MREERLSPRLDPVIDTFFDGISKEGVDQDQARQALTSHLMRQSYELIKETGIGARTIPGRGHNVCAYQSSLQEDHQ